MLVEPTHSPHIIVSDAMHLSGTRGDGYSGVDQRLQIDVTPIHIAPNQGELHNPVRPVIETRGLEVESENAIATQHSSGHSRPCVAPSMNSRKPHSTEPDSNTPMSGQYRSDSVTKSPRALCCVIIMMLLATSLVGCSGLSSTTPNARISADRQEINVGETVNFDARESTTPDPTIIDEYYWDFGDGEARDTKQGIVSHTYDVAGYHEAEVTVVNDNGESDTASISVFVNSPPIIELEMPTYIRAGDTARLDASNSIDPEGAAVEFMWDFDLGSDSDHDGDQTNDADATSSFVDLTIYSSGNRTGSVSVIDDKGAMHTVVWSLMVISRTFSVVWEEQHIEVEWSGYLEQGQSYEISHDPGIGARMIQVNATLTLARDILPITWPEDNFTLSLNIPETGWSTFASTSHDNFTENASASIDRGDMNTHPESGYTITADSSEGLVESLLNEPGERFGQGTWFWTITADQCDPDLPVDDVDPDQGNDWTLVVEFIIMVPRVSEIGV